MPADVELGRLNHIGIVVPGTEHDTVVDSLVRLFAGEINQSGDDEELNGRWSWVRASSGLVLEVCSPFENAASALTRFLERTGGGLHHVSFDSDDITACRTAARERGATLVGESDDHAGWAEFFVRPRETGYALFHWMQPVAERAFEALELSRSQR